MFGSSRWTPQIRAVITAFAAAVLAIGVTVTPAIAATPQHTVANQHRSPQRPEGPCDIYAAAGTPCVAAHSTTRALYASYRGPLYQVRRLSDGRVTNIGVVEPSRWPAPSAGGYADAAAQDRFCADTVCVITEIYDQSPMHNDLTRAPRGAFSGPAAGGADNLPLASMAPVSLAGHKVYGVFIEPGMGLRDDNTHGVPVDDQPEGMYWVVDGHHFNDGCCFDYGNAEIDSRDDGNGTMETSYFGDAPYWYHGQQPGPWIMTDQENNLVGCVNPGSPSKYCADLPSVTDRFVSAFAKGEPHHWASLGGNAQQGPLTTMFDGPRVDSSYDPMRKQGAIVLGNGGDNSNGSQGTFYEGVMTAGYPSDATDQAVQANIAAARYAIAPLALAPTSAVDTPPGLQTFAPATTQQVTETFTNTTGERAVGVKLGLSLPRGWSARVSGASGTKGRSATFASVGVGASVNVTFAVTSGRRAFDGDLVGTAHWTNPGHAGRRSWTAAEQVRNVDPIKINEFRTGTAGNATNSFVELYNAGDRSVDLSHWTLTEHAAQQAVDSTITIPAGTRVAAGKTYLLGLSPSGLAAPTQPGESTLNVTSTTGLTPGQQVQIGTGRTAETRTITALSTSGATGPRVPGKIGNAVKLSGDHEYVELPGNIGSGLGDFTISAWVNPADDTTWSRIFDFGTGTDNYMFLTLNAGGAGLRYAITTSGNGAEQQLTGGGQLPLNTWSHIAVTLSGNTGRLYLDGNLVATNTNMTLHPASLGNTDHDWIGRSQFPADPYLNATVDDFQIYDTALTADQVAALAGGQAGAGSVASYKFDEDSGAVAMDSSGNGRDATIVSEATGAHSSTPLWQPLPDGPITVPAGSTNVPVTSISGFKVGQKIRIGAGRKLETATVTAVGTPGTQAYLAAPASAGSTQIRVTSTSNITAGDVIHLDTGDRTETIKVTAVGTAGSHGSGLELAAPLTFDHAANLPFSDRGTGVSFSPATRFPHSSNEPVQALGGGLALDKPLQYRHAINTPILDGAVTDAGYQGATAPDQWFGGPALSAGAGSMALRNSRGLLVDSLNYGALVDPWLAEGYQGASGPGRSGCYVAAPGSAGGDGTSATRYPDGSDTDSNCGDFIITTSPSPGGPSTITLAPGPLVSLQATTGDTPTYLRHDDSDDAIVMSAIESTSGTRAAQDATFVETAGLADPSCVSFESVNRPGSYLRHRNFILHLQPNDGGSLFAHDATFCPEPGNSGSGTSFRSVNYPTKYIRSYQGGVYLASDGGSNAWDDAASWAADSSWIVAAPLAPPPDA